MKKGLVLGASKGIGKEIYSKLKELGIKLDGTSRKNLDTSKIDNVEKFLKRKLTYDILVLNTGGPPKKKFNNIEKEDWVKYFNQLFLSFCLILQKIKIKKNGYVFLISSHTIKRPEDELVLSNSFRVAISSVFKTYSRINSKNKITCLNIAPGPIKTLRLKKLVGKNLKKFENQLPMGRAGHPKEIAFLIKSIVENNIKYLNGSTINFDGNLSDHLF